MSDQAFDTGHDDPGFPHDWRGNDIGVFTRVIWRTGAVKNSSWKIGRVVSVSRVNTGLYDRWRLRIQWEDRDGNLTDDYSSNVRTWNVMVFREAAN